MKLLVAGGIAALSSSAFALGDGELTLGVRAADFQAAPQTMTMALSELGVAVHSDPLWNVPAVTVGLTAAYDDMRGSLGVPLSDFSGFTFGPEVEVRQTFGAWTPFATLGYRLGRFTGKGSENWAGSTSAAYELYGAESNPNDAKTKTFATAGTHFGIGASWKVIKDLSVVGQFDLGFERMETDARVISGSTDFDRRDTSFNSRCLQLGSQMNL